MVSNSLDSIPFNFVPQTGDRVDLDSACVDRASALSQTIPAAVRWQSYLALLALEGFAVWIDDLAVPVKLQRSQARLLLPNGFDLPAAITHVLLNQLKVCLVAVSDDREEAVELPISVVEEPSQVSHVYVAVTVDDEQLQAIVQCFLRYDQFVEYRQQTRLLPTPDRTYLLPRGIFDPDLHHLLLFATGLRPTAIALPTSTILTLPDLQQILLQPVVNTANWMQQEISRLINEFGQLADELVITWSPLFAQPVSAMRSHPSADHLGAHLVTILQELQHQGFEVPEQVRAVYQDVVMGNQEMRLAIVTWQLTEEESDAVNPEWSLLVILEPLQGTVPTDGIRFVIRDQQSVVIEKTLRPGVGCEVAQAIGTLDEQFTVTISLPSGSSVTLPPFAFQV